MHIDVQIAVFADVLRAPPAYVTITTVRYEVSGNCLDRKSVTDWRRKKPIPHPLSKGCF
jgi:hypothetical protein